MRRSTLRPSAHSGRMITSQVRREKIVSNIFCEYVKIFSADVTLACEGAAVKAHRIILCACSGYFSQLLRTIHPTQVTNHSTVLSD